MKGWLVLALLCLMGCGGPDYGDAFLVPFRAAQRAQSSGRYLEAAERFAAAAEGAQRLKDRDEALFMRARMLERAEHWSEAKAAYAGIGKVSPDGPRTARAAYDAATVEIERGDAERGWAELAVAIRRYPDHGSARRALELWCEHTAEIHGESALREELATWTELKTTALGQRLYYERARSFEREGDHQAARAAYLETARVRPYPKGNLTDDGYWHAARLAHTDGDHQAALAALSEMLSDREGSVGGSYVRPRFPAAQMRVGEVYRDGLGDFARARDAFRKTHVDYPDSVLADDAAWQETLMARRLDDADGACAAARRLKRAFPQSRYLRCLHLACSELPSDERPCARYIADAM